ncbi:hypothetical protein EVAR_45505_1 [Eumeta japonica]|uniref:Uncharacterized protein n=1 Tax=Eumeta variegata TaxID=151549 RepID=A0A4C1WGL3_EUMVA|nr:hypothetical protein EVAR_45505_1 [Eumeta japonica]
MFKRVPRSRSGPELESEAEPGLKLKEGITAGSRLTTGSDDIKDERINLMSTLQARTLLPRVPGDRAPRSKLPSPDDGWWRHMRNSTSACIRVVLSSVLSGTSRSVSGLNLLRLLHDLSRDLVDSRAIAQKLSNDPSKATSGDGTYRFANWTKFAATLICLWCFVFLVGSSSSSKVYNKDLMAL